MLSRETTGIVKRLHDVAVYATHMYTSHPWLPGSRDGNTTFTGCKLFSVLIHHIEPVSDRQVHYGDDLYVQATLQATSRQTDTVEAVSSWLQQGTIGTPGCCVLSAV
jgi:hypothetical protein